MSSPCECDAGSGSVLCFRHRVIKDARQRTLCRTSVDYFNLWEESVKSHPIKVDQGEDVKSVGRRAWEAIHSMKGASPQKIEAWLLTVPAFQCQCQKEARAFISSNPPPYGNDEEFFEWSWGFHTWIDGLTGDDPMTLEEAKEFWEKRASDSTK